MTKKRGRKAVFFSTDALIAVSIIFLSVLIIYPIIKYPQKESFIPEDILTVLSSLKIGEIENSYVQTLISEGKITDLNKSILEQIGEFYVTDKELAINLTDSIFQYLDAKENIGIWYENTLLASKNSTPIETTENIEIERQTISGIKGEEGESATGFSARAYLSSSLQKKYFYFGGYVGDGNISAKIDYNGTLDSIAIEIAINEDFDVYINDQYSGHYENSSSEFSPAKYNLAAYLSNFVSGENIIKFTSAGKNLYIAGGYIKISYEDSVAYEQPTKYYFPGIEGIINLYDGFYVPGTLNEMEISLHYNSNYTMFLSIGNITVFNSSTSGEETVTITNSQLSSLLNYADLSQKTIPLRLGLENITEETTSTITGNADIILITDVSGSMGWRLNSNSNGIARNNCSDPLLYDNSTQRLSLAKCLDKNFTAAILSAPGNRVGLVSFSGNLDMSHPLSNDLTSLTTHIDSYSANGGTCICCGINAAYNILNSLNDPSRPKFIVVMSDGLANFRCTNIQSCPPFNAGITCPWSNNRCFNGTSTSGYFCGNDNCINNFGPSMNNTIWSADRAHVDLDVNVSSVGFFLQNCHDANLTLYEVARVGGGMYKLGDSAEELFEAYSDIASSILSISYSEQIANVTGNVSTILYPDSYIKLNYTSISIPYGLITTAEKQFDDDYSGSFSIPLDSSILETKAISYSGPRWTDNVSINSISVYELSNYGQDYAELGDPYAINVPNSLVQQDNIVKITTGVSPANSTSGSQYNKIIYTLVKNISSYSPVVASAKGCIWSIEFEDNTVLNLNIPDSYSGTDNCYYNSTERIYDSNDAAQTAVYNLLKLLDLNLNNKIDTKFTEQDLQISLSEITGIPYIWSTEVQVRRWY